MCGEEQQKQKLPPDTWSHVMNSDTFRMFLNLWSAKPMVCMRVAFHENDKNYEDEKNDEDNSDSYKQGVLD